LQKAGELKTVFEDGNAEVSNASIQTSMYFDTTARLAISHGMWSFDAKTPLEYLQKNRDYTLNNVVEKIKWPTLVLEAKMDDAFSGGPQKAYNALRCPKKHILFTVEEGADGHCQMACLSLSNQRIFDWLDEIFKTEHPAL
jgi:hypothetical protein